MRDGLDVRMHKYAENLANGESEYTEWERERAVCWYLFRLR